MRCAQVAEHSRIVRLTTLDQLSGTGAKVNHDPLTRDLDDPPVRAGEHPAVEQFEGESVGAHKVLIYPVIVGAQARRAHRLTRRAQRTPECLARRSQCDPQAGRCGMRATRSVSQPLQRLGTAYR